MLRYERKTKQAGGSKKLIDTVLNLEDFKKVVCALSGKTWLELRMAGEGQSIENDVRVCVEEHFARCTIVVSVGLEDRILQCTVSRRTFNRHFLATELDDTKKNYEEWVKNAYGEIEKELGFKPIEGFWE